MPAKHPTLVHRSYRFDRTKISDPQGELERIAAKFWEEERAWKPEGVVKLARRRWLARIQARVAATIFQWMFTNMGRWAMGEVYRRAGWKVILVSPEAIARREKFKVRKTA
ncbi:hypothetical protein KW785_01320 [Candidatus Parcubacteria bacterium]|nr:hypothetical protein [Candidatus Parcubacteria bacterium]